MVQLKRNLLSVALASATMMLAAQAHAQSAPPAEQTEEAADAKKKDDAKTLDKVTVTGIRGSIERSIDIKQESGNIVEAVSAEDIGKLPDVSIADSVARLPGVTAQRFFGRAQEINIRGFSGDFSTTTLNGREQVSLGNNRGVEFDQYPSELMSSVLVYKTQNAALVGQGLSGTIDLRTVRPLDYDKRTIAMNVRGDMNKVEGDKEYGNRYSISYIDQFADNTIGLALGYAHLNNPGQTREFNAWGYDNGLLGGAEVFTYQRENKRDGFAGTLQFRPNGTWDSTLDVFYSKFDSDEDRSGLQFGTVWGSTGQPVSSTRDPSNNLVTAASFVNFRPIVRNDENNYRDKLTSIGWNNTFSLSESWTMSVDLSTSKADREHRILEGYAVLNPTLPGDTMSMSLDPSGNWFNFDYGNDYTDPSILRLADPGGWGGDRWQAGYLKDMFIEDKLNAARVDFDYAFADGAFSKLEFGANISKRTKSRASDENTLCLATNCASSNPVYLPIPGDAVVGSAPGFAGVTGVDLDLVGMLNGTYVLSPKNHPDINNKNWEVSEKLLTAYIQATIDTELFGAPLSGNIGVQAVRTDQDSTAIAMFNGVAISEPSNYGASYTDVLPSLNLKLGLPSEINVRFGLGRQMARPRMDELVSSANYGYDIQRDIYTGSGGNATLRPWLANAVDLSVEKYFGDTGYVTAGLFFKDLQTYIFNSTNRNFDYSQLPIPPGAPEPSTMIGEFTQPLNGEGGSLQGYEIAMNIPFETIWKPLIGFGFQGNYSDTTSSIHPGGGNARLPGLSKYISNMSLYFERWGFSARVSQRSRSAFRGEVEGFGGDRDRNKFFAGEKVTDFQMGYAFQSGALQGLSLLLQMYNLENEPAIEPSSAGVGYPGKYTVYGKTYLFGVNYKF